MTDVRWEEFRRLAPFGLFAKGETVRERISDRTALRLVRQLQAAPENDVLVYGVAVLLEKHRSSFTQDGLGHLRNALVAIQGPAVTFARDPREVWSGERSQEVKDLVAEVRKAPRRRALVRGSLTMNPTERSIRDGLLRRFGFFGFREVPMEWFQAVALRFARKMAGVLSPDKINDRLIEAVASHLMGELQELRTVYKRGVPRVLNMLDVIPAREILSLRQFLGTYLTNLLSHSVYPWEVARRVMRNRDAAGQSLVAAGYLRTRTVTGNPRVALARTAEEAIQCALDIISSPKPTPTPPTPSVAAAEEMGPLALFLAQPGEGGEFVIPPESWAAFEKLQPAGIFDSTRKVLSRIDAAALYILIGKATDPLNPHRAALREGLLHLLRNYRTHIDSEDYPEIVRAADHSKILEPAEPRVEAGPPEPLAALEEITTLPTLTEKDREDARRELAQARLVNPKTHRPNISQRPVASAVLKIWNLFFASLENPKVGRDQWETVSWKLASKLAIAISEENVSPALIVGLAEIVYGDLVALQPAFGKHTRQTRHLAILALDRHSAEDLSRLLDNSSSRTLLQRALQQQNCLEAAEKFRANQKVVLRHLETNGFESVARTIALLPPVFSADTRELALERAMMAARAHASGRWIPRMGHYPFDLPRGRRLHSGLAVLEEGYYGWQDWWHETEGYRLPATEEILTRFGLQEPATVLGRLRRYGPAEGIPGLVAIFAAPFVTQSILRIDPRRRPGEFHIANLGALHMLNSAGGAVADIVPQMRRGVSAVQIGNQVATSPSLTRTGLRSFAHRVGSVAGLAEGVVWAYPGYVLGEGTTSLVTDNKTIRAVGGLTGAVGVPLGLRIWLGREGMQRLAFTAAGRVAGPVGAATLLNDFVIGAHESFVRRDLSDEQITLREKAIEATPWWDRFVANLMVFFSIAGHNPSGFFEPQLGLEEALSKRERMIAASLRKVSTF